MNLPRPEFIVPVGNVGKRLRQILDLPEAADLTGAVAKLRFKPEVGGSVVERDAEISSETPTAAACTSFVIGLSDDWESSDVATAGRFSFQWKITLANDTPLNLPEVAPTRQDPDRDWQVMEVVSVI